MAVSSPSPGAAFSSRNPGLSGWPALTLSRTLSWRGCKNHHIKGDVPFQSRVWKESGLTYEIGTEMVELPLFQKSTKSELLEGPSTYCL